MVTCKMMTKDSSRINTNYFSKLVLGLTSKFKDHEYTIIGFLKAHLNLWSRMEKRKQQKSEEITENIPFNSIDIY